MAFNRNALKVAQKDRINDYASTLEYEIDQFLVRNFSEEYVVYVFHLRSVWDEMNVPHGDIRARIVEQLRPAYLMAGWSLEHDERFGYLFIRPVTEN